VGEIPAACISPCMLPIAVAVSTSEVTDCREATLTIVVLTSNPASLRTFAATSAFSCLRQQAECVYLHSPCVQWLVRLNLHR
jgi:hypothetical protein